MNIYLIGGIPIIALGVLVLLLYMSKNRTSYSKMKSVKASSQLANANYNRIKELLTVAKPLVRLRFRLLVGPKRYKNYTYQG